MTWTPRLCISGAGFSSNASTLVLSAAATEQRRRRPGLQKLKTASTQVTGIFHPPPSLPPSSYSSSTFHPRAGLQGTVLGRSRCHGALPWPGFFAPKDSHTLLLLRFSLPSFSKNHPLWTFQDFIQPFTIRACKVANKHRNLLSWSSNIIVRRYSLNIIIIFRPLPSILFIHQDCFYWSSGPKCPTFHFLSCLAGLLPVC